ARRFSWTLWPDRRFQSPRWPAARCRAAQAARRVPRSTPGTPTRAGPNGGAVVSSNGLRSLDEGELQFSQMCGQEVVFIRRQIAGGFFLEHGQDLDHLASGGDVDD